MTLKSTAVRAFFEDIPI